MSTRRLPIAARWSLFALGHATGDLSRPMDPVSAWVLEAAPQLRPTQAVPTVLSLIRARTVLIDRMLMEVLGAAVEPVQVNLVGAGFDARWARLEVLSRSTIGVVEVEGADLVRVKDTLLAVSPWRGAWSEVERQPQQSDEWALPRGPRRNVTVLEGLSTRFHPDRLRTLLRRVRSEVGGEVILDMPGFVSMLHNPAKVPKDAAGAEVDEEVNNPYRWSRNTLRELGWEVAEDVWLTSRPTLRSPTGPGLCHGMEPLRVLRLVAR